MSISPQFVCSTSVAGLFAGSSVAGLARCCSPLFVGLAGVQAPPEPPAGAVAVLLVPAAADVGAVEPVESLLFPHPAAASATAAARETRTGRDMGAQDNQRPCDAVSPSG